MSLYDLLAIPAATFGDAEALVTPDGRGTYVQLLEEVDRFAAVLAERGVGPGTVIATLDVNSTATALAPFVAARLESVLVPLNYRARHEELAYMLGTAGAGVLLSSPRYAGLAAEAVTSSERQVWVAVISDDDGHLQIQDVRLPESIAPPVADVDPDLAVLMFTSGSTSRPKAVELTHDQLFGFVMETTTLPERPAGTTLLSVPLYHIAGLTALLASVFGGRRVVLLAQFDPGEWLAAVARERVTHAFLVPTMLSRVLDHLDFGRTDLSSLRVLSYGSAPMPTAVIRRAISSFPETVGFVNAFGQTETASTVTMLLPEDHRLTGSPEEVERKVKRLSSVGRALPDVRVAILEDGDQPLPAGTVGEVAIESTRSMRGYRCSSETAARVDRSGWLRTGDLGYLDSDGYLFLSGRKGNLIIRGGENVAAEEVESVLLAHPDVESAAVLGLPDPEWGETVAAAVVIRQGSTVTADDLREHCRSRLASYKKPQDILIVDRLPLGPMGKVVHSELARLFVERSGG
jgi:acyl-CoA synthetase (AMP-forming)/AMP-acid ligase II